MLECDATIAVIMSNKHAYAYDLISFDFAEAFDKAPHVSVIEAAADHGADNETLVYIARFLAERTFCVRIDDHYSGIAKVRDALLHKIDLPLQAFADDFKFVGRCCSALDPTYS